MAEARQWKVMLVDDSEIALAAVSKLLRDAGFDVKSALSVNEFQAAVSQWSPDVILTDVNMPGMTGVELCRVLKDAYDTAHVPIVLCSSKPATELEVLARECGANGFVSKADAARRLPEELRLLCEELAW